MGITISKPELVTLALGELGAVARTADTEDVAVKAHELSPSAFAWRKYANQINLELVRVALVDASRSKSGGLVQGSGRGGWVLTDVGVRWFERRREALLRALGKSVEEGGARVKRPEPRHLERERARIMRSDGWVARSNGESVIAAHARAIFRIDQYTPPGTITLKIRALLDILGDDPVVGAFLAAMAHQIQEESAKEGGPHES